MFLGFCKFIESGFIVFLFLIIIENNNMDIDSFDILNSYLILG